MRVFYWYRNILGRWTPCIADQMPSKSVEGPKPKINGEPIILKGEQISWDLDRCVQEWPLT